MKIKKYRKYGKNGKNSVKYKFTEVLEKNISLKKGSKILKTNELIYLLNRDDENHEICIDDKSINRLLSNAFVMGDGEKVIWRTNQNYQIEIDLQEIKDILRYANEEYTKIWCK
jgi:hypothetical protein